MARLEQLAMYRFKNLKNFADSSIDLDSPSLTVLIGKNGSGKTNLIEGIKILDHLVKGVPLHKFTDIGKGGSCEVRGGLDNCIDFHSKKFQLNFHIESSFNYSITIAKNSDHQIIIPKEKLEASIKGNTVCVFNGEMSKDKRFQTVDVFNPSNDIRDLVVTIGSSFLSQYRHTTMARRNVSEDEKNLISTIEKSMAPPYVFDPDPKSMRLYEAIKSGDMLSPNGSNLSAVLYLLKRNKPALNRINKAICQLPEEPFTKIDFVKTRFDDVLFGFYTDDKHEKLLDARLLSDGTLRMLAILAALESVPEESQVVIEEFDNGLHPSRANLLIDYFEKTIKLRKLRILITTHNPAFMNALNDKQLERVVLCHRDHTNGHSKLTKYTDFPDIDILKMQGNLGDLVTRDVIEKSLLPDFEEKRTKIFKEWVERSMA